MASTSLIDPQALDDSSPLSDDVDSSTQPKRTLLTRIGAKGVGAMAGAVTTSLLMTPFDVLKTRLQTRRPAPKPTPITPLPPNHPSACCQQTLLNPTSSSACTTSPAITSLSSSSSSAASSSIRSNAADVLRSSGQRGSTGVAAAMTLEREPIGCTSPSRWREMVEELKMSGKVGKILPGGFFNEVGSVWRETGLRGFWKGVGTTLSMGVPSSAIYMVGYDHLRSHLILSPSIATSPTLTLLTPFLAGSIARTLSATLISPLELFRTRLQAFPSAGEASPTVRSTLSSLREIVGREGVLTLWRGLGATLWRDVPFSGIYWGGYELLKGKVLVGPMWEKEKTSEMELGKPAKIGLGDGEWARAMAAGAGSGMVAALVTTPFDVLKTRRQVFTTATTTAAALGSPNYKLPIPTAAVPLLRHIVQEEGAKALFAGLVPRLAKVAPACAIMVSCYEGVGAWMNQEI